MGGETQPGSGSRQRIDKWLFFTRMVKSRSLAQSHIQSGHVRINGERALQPSQTIKAGDKVELALERRDVVLIVKSGGERRGPYEEARLLYEDLTPPPDEAKRLTPYEQAIRATGTGRPTKKDRRAIDRLISDED
ncbi:MULTISPECIES: RNA-binding S4 domain-containing protein [Rhizobium]|uniref:Heat shock protein n=1 Tax=Rhizobium favelukesii TaxID=348824 RepID=W6RH49_9HYPH|nr:MULTISPECIES: RNA-binding S4 domain-containing protein [Rhizobium]MCA0803709.1 RNA-binding S4 domain-containing protein [Rhizobium sp. T1473]MCS0457217.1 RNA-binding S4 domain-containing protein [Rhizobium favelukesii]UFS82723.1 RNA-binding S4 domain-containing protein [Rhizobium sp. T136]CDM59695.1 putative heat shock protein [Rhizobium favelukesii]